MTSNVKTGKEVDLSKDEVDVTSVVTIGAYKAEVKKAVYKAGKTAEAKVVFSKNGEELITLEGNGNGNITPSGEKSEFGQINITMNILGKAKIVCKILDGTLFYNNLDKADSNYNNESTFKLFIENANKQMDAKLYLDGAFHLSFTVLYAIGHWVVFRVGGWSPRIPTRFHVSGRTLELAQLLSFSPTWFSHSLTGLPMPFG